MTQQSWQVWVFGAALLAVGLVLHLVSRRFAGRRDGADAIS